MHRFRIHHWPIFLTTWSTVTFIISYVTAVATKTVYPFFPYISDTGAKIPASCFFGQLVNIAALLTGIVLYIRYRQIDLAIKSYVSYINPRWNKLCYRLGLIVPLGISIVANFQGDFQGPVIILVIHIAGAALAFVVIGIYLIIQTKLTFDLEPYYYAHPKYAVSRNVQYFRVFLTISYLLSFAAILPFAVLGALKFNGQHYIWWTPEHGGYIFHLVSTISEWILVYSFLVYTITMTDEFKSISYKGISIKRETRVVLLDTTTTYNLEV